MALYLSIRKACGWSTLVISWLLGFSDSVSFASSITDPPRIWVAETASVHQLHPEDPALDSSTPNLGARALAIDSESQEVWIHSGPALSLLDADGGLVQSWQPTSVRESDGPVHLAAGSYDGSLWVAEGPSLSLYNRGGQLLFQRTFGEDIQDIGLDRARQRLWLATRSEIFALDALTGSEILTLAPAGAPQLTSLAIDPTSGDLWLGHTTGLLHYTASGQPVFEQSFEPGPAAVETLAAVYDAGTFRGLWSVDGPEVAFYDPELRRTFQLEPFGPDAQLSSLAVDPSNGSAWVSDGRSIAAVSPGGVNEVRYDLGESAEIHDLAVLRPVRLPRPPELEIVRPRDGGVLREARPVIEVHWTEGDYEVLPESLEISLSGSVLEVECEPVVSGLVCEPVLELEPGPVFLGASVADREDLRSMTTVVSFRIEADPESPTGDPGGSADDPGQTPTYTPVVSPRGVRPNVPFVAGSDIDRVDPSSGNLTLDIPFGQTYEVGPLIRYQVRAVYNSKVWEHHEVACALSAGGCGPGESPSMFALTNPESNAGLGWEVHFGRLYAPIPPAGLPTEDHFRWPNRDGATAQGLRWLYVAPDGARHHLYALPGRSNGTNSRPVRYTKDGSYLRMQQTSATQVKVESPDGLVSVFERTDESAGTNFCGGGVTGCWRFQRLEDPYGNRMSVSYATEPTKEIWTVSDSTGREHKLTFGTGNTGTGGGDCTTAGSQFCSAGNDEWGDPRRVLKRVKVAAFGGGKATYEVRSSVRQLSRGCPHDTNLPSGTERIRLPLLDRIEPPLGQPFVFEYDESLAGACNPRSGTLTKVTLPTGGAYAYEYSNSWQVPTRCSYHHAPDAEASFDTVGVIRRKVLYRNGNVENDTRYSSQLLPAISSSDLSGPTCQRAKYRVTTVDGPENGDGNRARTKTYHALYAGPQHPSGTKAYNSWQVTDSGLPYTKTKVTDSAAGGKLFLSQETYLCRTNESGDPTTCPKKRSTYVRYTSEYRGCSKAAGDGADCFQLNPTLLRRQVRYHDDREDGEPHFVETVHAQPDGAGHFGKTTTIDDFDGSAGSTRQVTTGWDVTGVTLGIDSHSGYLTGPNASTYLPSPTSRWVLGTYDEKRTWESASGRTYVTGYEFNSQGTLLCSRRQRVPSARSGDDLVVELQLGTAVGTNAGLPIREIVAGGSGASLPTTSACSGGGGSAVDGTRFVLQHTYQDSSLAKTQMVGYPTWYEATIDENTGLPSATFNPQDQKTTHSFDLLGRLTQSTPEASLQGATLSVSYSNLAGADASVLETEERGGVQYRWQETHYDHLGRQIAELRKIPGPDGNDRTSKRIQQWDPAGHLRRTSTWQNESGFDRDLATRYQDVDVAGRAQKLIAPDGQETRALYFGDRIERQIAEVYTGGGTDGLETVWITTEKDAFGRVVRRKQVLETHFSYDPYGQVIRSWRSSGDVTQSRTFTYDARGLLLGESHPEYAGTSIQYTRDAFGQVRQKTHGSRVLDYEYDTGGRPTQIADGDGRIWKEWEWGSANAGTNYQKGKLVRATRNNAPPGIPFDIPVVETYEYRGRLGLLSQQKTWVENLHGTSEAIFTQSLEYDPVGQRTHHTYPVCSGLACTGSDDQPAPAHTVSTTYRQGMAIEVSSSQGPWGRSTYHPNFQMASLDTRNGVEGRFSQGTNGMVRPQQITYSRSGTSLYDSGEFEYDELGNIHQIGEDAYRYDRASRLTYGSVSRAGSRWEAYRSDRFDNIVQRQNDGDATWVPVHVDASSNRALGDADIEYDAWGNLTKVGPPSFTMSYDALDMQGRFEQHVGNTNEYLYAYGPGDRRILTFDVRTGELLYQLRGPGGEVLREVDVLGAGGATFTHQKDLIHGPDGLIATISRGGETFYFHKDHLGTPRAVTDSAGVRKGKHDYYPFGQETPNHPQHPDLTVKWTGHQRDLHGFSDYMMGRTCLYPLLRFASVDPARDGWNLYAYGRNNPIKYVDPDGTTVATALDLIKKHRTEIQAASKASKGKVTELELARLVFQENRNDFNLIRNNDDSSVPLLGGPELKNVGARMRFLFLGEHGSLGIVEMRTDTAARLLGFDPSNLTGLEKGIIDEKLNNPGEALKLAGKELVRLKAKFPSASTAQILNAYNRGDQRVEQMGEVGLRSEVFLDKIKKATQ